MKQTALRTALVAALVVVGASHADADWLRFRGPNGSGICNDDKPMPVRWSKSANLKWKTELPGPGMSSPIVVGDRVYVTCYSGYGLDREKPGDQKDLKRHLACIDRNDGRVLWSRAVAAVLPEDPYEGVGVTAHGYASHTPVSDGNNVYAFFGKTGVLAFNKDGKQLWQTSVGTESDPHHWGSASSPIVYKDFVIVPAAAESEAIVALDKQTGREVWRQEAAGLSDSWSTPILVDTGNDRTDVVMAVTKEIWGLNPQTGKLRWYCEGAKSRSYCSSPVSDGDVVYAIEGRSGAALAVRAGGKGDVTKSHVLWTGRNSARFGAPIVHEGRIYSFANDVASVLDAKTGERLSRSRLEGGRGDSGGMGGDFSSPILADGKLYYVRRSGDMHVLRAGSELEPLAVNHVCDASEEFGATPAASDGDLFVRSNKRLYCVSALGEEVKDVVASRDTRGAKGQPGDGADRPRRGRRRGRGRGNFDPAAIFKERDANGDGKLTGDELSDRLRGGMAQMDTDKDGALTLDEFQSGLRRMFAQRGRGGRGGDPSEGKPDRPFRPELEE